MVGVRMEGSMGGWCAAVILVVLSWAAARAAEWVWQPRRLERALRAQGLHGNPYRLLYGDIKDEARLIKEARSRPITPFSHCILPRVLPSFHRLITHQGKFSFSWLGPDPRVTIYDPKQIREVLSNKFDHFPKPKLSLIGRLLTTGLASYEGEKWATHRKIINPAFHVEKLKRMLPAFYICCGELINRWVSLLEPAGSGEIDIWPELQNFTGDVISRTAFGSSYVEGQRIFQLQSEQVKLVIQAVRSVTARIPGYRFLPTPGNIRRKEIDRQVSAILRGMIEKREKAMKMGNVANDLLGLLLDSNSKQFEEHESSTKNAGMTTEEVRGREEVLQVFGKNKPDIDGLNHLKIVTMILYEVLRLYPPAVFMSRRTHKPQKLGDLTLPSDILLYLPVLAIHHDPEFWGEDAQEFNPERFAEGVSKASKNQAAFFPFGWGPRICIGQSFAMLEAKMGLSMILQHFSFELSPKYVHAPCTVITLQPQHGAPVMLHKL